MKEGTARALALAACALQAYVLAKSFKREVIDPYREPPKENDAQGLEIMNQDAIKGYPLNSPARMKERYGVDAQDVLAVLHKPDGAPLPLNEAWNVLESVQTLIEKKACETARTQTVADVHL